MAGNRAFGERIRQAREVKKRDNPSFSLRQFAMSVGISATFLSKVENGEFDPPAPDKIKRIAMLLDINADELLALANRIDPELPEIIREHPRAMADFLRTARDVQLSRQEIEAMTRRIREEHRVAKSGESG
ncbi:MAG: helix-turn-helix transcriptional regulator [Magnetococcales bacterium]|nr:helix-turn-helix transcriptional regulator [Magnetococcales bacterium]